MEIQSEQQPISKIKDEEKYKCGICEITFDAESSLANHFKTGHKKCNICGKSCPGSDLTRHKKLAHEKGQEVKDEVHGQIRKYKCNLCDNSFKRADHLKNHRETVHSNDRPYQCNLCQKSFKCDVLAKHKAEVHDKLKPHKCEKCEKMFARADSLKKHFERVHEKLKPYQCQECVKRPLSKIIWFEAITTNS